MTDTIEITQTTSGTRKKRMSKYQVVLHNDDATPMDFVIYQLMDVFSKSVQEAHEITMSVHYKGKGIAGVFSKEIAETKVKEVHDAARSYGYPLTLSTETI